MRTGLPCGRTKSGSVPRLRSALGFGLVGTALALGCSSGEYAGDDPPCTVQNLTVPSDTRTEAGCEINLTRGSRSVRVEMRSSPGCDAGRCEVACRSPDLSLAFVSCTRGPKGSPFGFTLTRQSAAGLQSWFGAGRGDTATVTVTCAGEVVWAGLLPLCVVPL